MGLTESLIAALSPSDIGKVVTREIHIDDRVLVIRSDLTTVDGEPVVRTLRWVCCRDLVERRKRMGIEPGCEPVSFVHGSLRR